jgi:hypothetical protein
MTEQAAKHAWVEVHTNVLAPGERAPHVPADTQQLPLAMHVTGGPPLPTLSPSGSSVATGV